MLGAQIKYRSIKSAIEGDSITNQMSDKVMPVIGVWVWGDGDLKPDGFKKAIDMAAMNSPFNLLVPFLRFPEKEVMDEEVYRQVKLAANYAVKKGVGLVPDLDVRSARRAFMKKYPGEQQEMLRLKEIALTGDKRKITISAIKDLNDHYSGGQIPKYNPLESSLLRVYAYMKTPDGIDPTSIIDITQQTCVTGSTVDSLMITIPAAVEGATHACAMASFSLFYPDVFAPHLMQFQREILDKYADLPLSGACKDEWGFPPYYPRFYSEGYSDFWYSPHRAKAYSEITGGRELLSDCLLMAFPMKGKTTERETAINYFREMSFQRNSELECHFYKAVKSVFGDDAAVTVHSTWWPYPDQQEFRKNGLDWWASKRDWAQTDETVPIGVRTSLSKKWNSPVWYNMYYTARLHDQVWGSALGGGRINYLGFQSLFDRDIMRAETRIRLLNYISNSPLDCPVAVIFGHASAMNWAGDGFDDVGMSLVDSLWHAGYPADLIPSSEIENGSLRTDDNGNIVYGPQKYSAAVLFQPEYEKESTSLFFKKAAKGSTSLFRIGDWTRFFNGNKVNEEHLLPKEMELVSDVSTAFQKIVDQLEERKIITQTPATAVLDTSYYKLRGYHHTSFFPPNSGVSKLIDGTHLFIAGTNRVSGDPIRKDTLINNHHVSVDAIGVVGIRFDKAGKLDALAASDLRYFEGGGLVIALDNPIDVALWKDQKGKWAGVIQADKKGEIPDELAKITDQWRWLKLPVPPTSLSLQPEAD
jgi:hypothetical protein